jgi:hypothetical protein
MLDKFVSFVKMPVSVNLDRLRVNLESTDSVNDRILSEVEEALQKTLESDVQRTSTAAD